MPPLSAWVASNYRLCGQSLGDMEKNIDWGKLKRPISCEDAVTLRSVTETPSGRLKFDIRAAKTQSHKRCEKPRRAAPTNSIL
jgi:hypothetical protein